MRSRKEGDLNSFPEIFLCFLIILIRSMDCGGGSRPVGGWDKGLKGVIDAVWST